MYIPGGSTIHLGNKAPMGVFGYLRNNGNISMQQNANLYFMGKIWMNETKATVTDEGGVKNSIKGGTVHFNGNNSLYGNVGQQILHPGYIDSTSSGVCFTNISLDNGAGLIITSDMAILGELNFRRGHVYLNNYNVVMGDSANSGKISGYDQSRYFVTGSNPIGGFLKYSSVPSNMSATFPIGPDNKNYAPLQMLNRGSADGFFARAFDKVYTNATSGSVITDSTLEITWNVGKTSTASNDVMVTLQHDKIVEDPVFNAHREASYISLFGSNKWDKPAFRNNPQTPGTISSSFSIPSAMMNTRNFTLTDKSLFLSKRITKGKKYFDVVNVFSPNGDNINDRWIVRGLRDYQNCVVEIYNRYGQMIFRSIGYNQPWDGTYKGQPMPVATYYYVIDLKNGDKPIGGSVTLLR
jgi:gliding motility-associated-like protein